MPPSPSWHRASSREKAEADEHAFRHQVGFLGVLCIAFTGCFFLMTFLRTVLEPFLWAMFLVITLHPLATMFESALLGIGRCFCGCRMRDPDQGRCPLRGQERSARELELGGDGALEGSSLCGSCCESFSRIVSVSCALAVVLAAMCGLSMFIFKGALRIKEDLDIYEQGAKESVDFIKQVGDRFFHNMPRMLVDEIADNAIRSAKLICSDLAGLFFEHAGLIMFDFLMLGLYVMFWLCTPMPLNTKTERIFRRYMCLKGSACICYGFCVGLMLRILQVELAEVFGVLSFFLSFIPEVGAFLAMAMPIPVILFDSRLEAPFFTLFVACLVQLCLKFVFSNIVEVKLVENDSTMKMHPVVTLLAVTFFGATWGPTGMLLSVPMMTYMKVVLLSDKVPAAYRDPVLIMLEGDRSAPERHRRRRTASQGSQDAGREGDREPPAPD